AIPLVETDADEANVILQTLCRDRCLQALSDVSLGQAQGNAARIEKVDSGDAPIAVQGVTQGNFVIGFVDDSRSKQDGRVTFYVSSSGGLGCDDSEPVCHRVDRYESSQECERES